MKKETTNTFNKGMIRDLHPLTTPNDTLTDALNATLITYNGNEGVLQNDMGNVKIDAELPAGYVPVGMKEHGGIIYVAAYNPETGKGQVGSFPSPKQVIKDVEWSVNSDEGNLASIEIEPIVYKDNTYLILNEIIKKELFGANNGEARVFHPGDKFIINISSNTRTLLKNYVDREILDIELGVIKNDGGIEIMKSWTKGTNGDFISCININDTLEQDYISPQDAIKDPSIVQVFDASSSGKLILIITLHTLDTFNVIRTYSLIDGPNNTKLIKVTFKGEAEKDGVHLDSTDSNSELQIGKDVSSDLPSSTLDLTEDEESNSITVYPAVSFGYIDRMKKEITVNFDKIRKNKDAFGEWRFYVTLTYVKIGWSYDFYNLDGTKEIEYIKMYFHKLEDGYNRTDAKQVVFLKEYYNGNFEDYINILDAELQYKSVYIVEIVKKLKGENNESIITFKMLYLSPLYNSYYNGFYKNNSIGEQNDSNTSQLEYSTIDGNTVNLTLKYDYTTKLSDAKVDIKTPGSDLELNLEVTDSPKYARTITLEEFDNLDDKNYITRIRNTYTTDINITGEFKDLDDNIIGQIKPGLIQDIIGQYSFEGVSKDESKEFIPNTNAVTFDPVNDYEYADDPDKSSESNDNGTLNIKISSEDSRLILGISSDLLHDVFPTYGLVPLYSPKYSTAIKNKLAPYWNLDNARCMCGDADDTETIFYNATLHKNGSVVSGVDAGAGIDDAGLYAAATAMDRPLTNIFAGINGDQSELTFDSDVTSTYANGKFRLCGNTLAELNDNYLIACWRFNDGETRFVNLITTKYLSDDNTNPFNTRRNKWPRVDVILRSILSQLFTVGWITKSADYISPNVNYYRYQEGKLKIRVTLNYNSNNLLNLNDVMTSTLDGYTDKTLTLLLEEKWHYGEDESGKITVAPGRYPLTNLIPKVSVQLPSELDIIEIEIPNMYNMDLAIANYLNSSYVRDTSLDTTYDITKIYTVDTINNSETPNIHDDGTFEWQNTPSIVEVTGDLTIYRWDYNLNHKDPSQGITEHIIFKDFADHFITSATLNLWDTIPENESNDVIANLEGAEQAGGTWTNAKHDDAPDLVYNVLYSELISPLEKSSNPFN